MFTKSVLIMTMFVLISMYVCHCVAGLALVDKSYSLEKDPSKDCGDPACKEMEFKDVQYVANKDARAEKLMKYLVSKDAAKDCGDPTRGCKEMEFKDVQYLVSKDAAKDCPTPGSACKEMEFKDVQYSLEKDPSKDCGDPACKEMEFKDVQYVANKDARAEKLMKYLVSKDASKNCAVNPGCKEMEVKDFQYFLSKDASKNCAGYPGCKEMEFKDVQYVGNKDARAEKLMKYLAAKDSPKDFVDCDPGCKEMEFKDFQVRVDKDGAAGLDMVFKHGAAGGPFIQKHLLAKDSPKYLGDCGLDPVCKEMEFKDGQVRIDKDGAAGLDMVFKHGAAGGYRVNKDAPGDDAEYLVTEDASKNCRVSQLLIDKSYLKEKLMKIYRKDGSSYDSRYMYLECW